MTTTRTIQATYTVADVGKAFESFRSNLRAIAESTGLATDKVERWADDVIALARAGYLASVSVVLYDGQGVRQRATRFTPSENASGWKSELPGSNLWPSTPAGSLSLVVQYSPTWDALSEESKASFKKTLKCSWGPSSEDTSFSDLMVERTRYYASNAYGLEHVTFRRQR